MGRLKRIRKMRMKLRKQKQERKEILKAIHRLPKAFKRMGEMFEEANRGLIKGFKNFGEVLERLRKEKLIDDNE